MKNQIPLDRRETPGYARVVRRSEKSEIANAMGSPVATGSSCASQHSLSQAAGDSPALATGSVNTLRNVGCLQGLDGHYRLLPRRGTRVLPLDNNVLEGKKKPYLFISKLCKACGEFKKLWHFYRVKDRCANHLDSGYWYPSARCKPCHNALRVENRRKAKAVAR